MDGNACQEQQVQNPCIPVFIVTLTIFNDLFAETPLREIKEKEARP
jgi:hypothetical protein